MPTKTPLGLNQWNLDEKPQMEEFNADNKVIDSQLAKVNTQLSNKATQSSVDTLQYGGKTKNVSNENLANLSGAVGTFTRHRVYAPTGTLPWNDLSDCVVEEYVIDTGWKRQTLFDLRSNRCAVRMMVNNSWLSWSTHQIV